MHLLNRGVHCENQRFFPNCTQNKMDYRQKMVVSSHHKYKQEDDDDEDLEALRLAALQTLRAKDSLQKKKQYPPSQRVTVAQITQPSQAIYKGQKVPIRGFYQKAYAPLQKQNGTCYYPSPCNPNLITIVPVDGNAAPKETELSNLTKVEDANTHEEKKSCEESKFYRYKDNASGSEEEDLGDHKNDLTEKGITESIGKDGADADEESTDKENESAAEESPARTEEDDDDEDNDDDDDVLLMADLEEEDSLERLMDEMEREMNVDKPSEKREKRRESLRKDMKESRRREEPVKTQNQKTKLEQTARRNKSNSPSVPLLPAAVTKNEQRSVSPHTTSRPIHKRRSLSPRSRSRKKSPRRSPRRSPVRQIKKLQREIPRYRSPRKSPARFSPRPRSPRLSPRLRSPRSSPRRSPNRSPRRSPLRKLSPRGRSPRLSPHVRSPRALRSRSPRLSSRSRSPRLIRSPRMSPRPRSPRLPLSRSPRLSPRRTPTRHLSRSRSPKLSPQLKSPRLSPRRLSPARRLSPRSRTPRLSPRRGSPRFRSPKRSPRRSPPRLRSPRPSPHKSPWSSPRNSPRLSPRRRRSPKWSPKESSRKPRPRSITPDGPANPPLKRDVSPVPKGKSPDNTRIKIKREDVPDKPTVVVSDSNKESRDVLNDPILEARRRKFESTKPIDPVHANKKIKLTKKDNTAKKPEPPEEATQETTLVAIRKSPNSPEEYEATESDLCLDADYEFEDLPEPVDETSVVTVASSITVCEEPEPAKVEKERPSKKKKKRDKELYQVGKLKNELPLSERIGKEKKCKKHKDIDGPNDEVETIFEDLTVDEEGDLRAELSRRRAERLNRTAPIQSARLVQSAFKGVVSEAAKTNAKANRRHIVKTDEKSNQKEVRRVTVLHRPVSELHDSEDETMDSKVPVRFRLGINKPVQDTREAKASRKASKRQSLSVNSEMGSGGVGEIPTIFHPRRSRAPSIVLSEDQQNNGPYASPVQVVLDTSGCEQQGCSTTVGCGDSGSSCRSVETAGSGVGSGGGGPGGGQIQGQTQGPSTPSCLINNPAANYQHPPNSSSSCYASCCAESAKKIYFGVCVTICVTASWVGATHCIRYLFFRKPDTIEYSTSSNSSVTGHPHHHVLPYNAPFFTTWFCTNWAVLYFPVYFICRAAKTKCSNPSEIVAESLRGFRDKGFTGGRFLTRCSLFCGLWVATNYMYIHSLRILLATDVMALFATNVSCVYLLSWVILHEQFVGVRIVAVILCDTGIALLAYMDGITGSPTLGGVVLAASAAAGSAVYKVLFKKVIGETTFGQVSLFFSLIGLCNAALLWPVCLALYFSGAESVHWAKLPWAALLSASILHLVANMLGNFSIALTYDLFITLGLITAVPVSAALDVVLYGAHFVGMKLAGMILIAVGFFLVMFPDNWPDYITRLLRTTSSQHRGVGRGVNRSRRQSIQHRQFRRNYGVSSSQGDGQTLLPLSATNNTTTTTTTTNMSHHHNANISSSSEPSHRVPTSIISTTTNNHHRSFIAPQVQQDGAGDTGMGCQAVHHAT